MSNNLKYHIITFGCQMNKSDSERVRSVLEKIGFSETNDEKEADFILINTCSVRQTAEDRVYGKMVNFVKYKKNKPNLILGVTGCMPGRDKDEKLRKKLSMVDLFFPIDDIPQLSKWMSEIHPEVKEVIDIDNDYLSLQPEYTSEFQAFVPIQTGCNQFCTYCTVPYSRGQERYRPVAEILSEIEKLNEKKYKEVTLLGQAVNSYHPKDQDNFSRNNPYQDNFAALLWEINQFTNIERIHYTAPHPNFMNDEIVDALTLPKHLNYLHLPVQSGSNKILQTMNRKYAREDYLAVIDKIKKKVPGIALGTDIIVGFCGETEKDFQDTVDLYKDVEFDISYTAIYSPRSGTAAYKIMQDNLSRQEKKKRWWTLQKLMEEITWEKNQYYKNKVVSVLVEKCEQNMCSGNSGEMKVVKFIGDSHMIGQIVRVKINRAEEWVLHGEIVKD